MRNNCGLISTNTSIELIGVFNNFIKNVYASGDPAVEYSKLEDMIVKYVYDNHKKDSKEDALSQKEADFIHMQFAAYAYANMPILFKSGVDPKFSEKLWGTNKPRDVKLFLANVQTVLIDATSTTLPSKVKALYDTDVNDEKKVAKKAETLKAISLTTSTKIGDVQHIADQSELKAMFANANTAYLLLKRTVSNHIVRNYLINSSTDVYNANSIQVDQSIKANKIKIYNNLIKNFTAKGLKFSDTELTYYKTGKINDAVDGVLNRIAEYYNSKGITNIDLEHWTQTNKEEITDYNNFIILSNFDNLLLSYGKGIFQISESYLNSSDERLDKPKYVLDIESNISSSIFETGEYNVTDEQSSMFKMFISSMPSLTLDGSVQLDKEININTVNNVMAKLLHAKEYTGAPKYDPTNSLESMKAILEFAVNNFTRGSYTQENPKIKDFKKVEKDVLFSIYMYFFRDENELISSKSKVIMKDTLKSKLRESYGETDETGSIKPISSFYQLAANSNIITGMDYYNIMVSNFDKTYLNDYTEYAYDKDKKVVTINNPKERLINSSEILFTNNLNNFINQDFSANKDIIIDKFKKVSLGEGASTIVTFDLGSKKTLKIDLKTSEVLYFDGETSTQLANVKNFTYADERPLLEILNRILPQLQLVDDNGNDFYYSTFKDVFSDVDKNVTSLAELSRVAAYASFISLNINDIGIEALKNNVWLRSLTSNYYNEEDDEFSIAGLFSRYSDISSKIGEGLAIINGETHKAVITVGNVTVPTVGEVRHLYTMPKWRTWLMAQNNGTLKGMPIQNNLFMSNSDFLEGYVIRSFVKVGDNPKHSSKMSSQEVMHTLIVHDYISAVTKYDMAYIQPTVFADKNSHNSVKVNMNSIVKIPGIAGKTQLKKVSAEDLKRAMYLNNMTYYTAIENKITSTYIPVLEKLLGYKVGKTISEVSKAMSNIDPIDGKSPSQVFRDAFYKEYNGKEYLIEDLGIKVNKKGIPSISPLLLHYVDMYRNSSPTSTYNKTMEKNEKQFADKLKDFGVKIEFKDGKGKLNPIFSVSTAQGVAGESAKTIFDKLNIGITAEEFEKTWVSSNTKYLIIHNGVDLNPLLRHFFYMDNYISENLMQASMGTIHNHPFKGDPTTSTIEQMESSQQTAEYKRQLQGTPMKPLNIGLINGVGETMKSVFMTDINNPVFTSFGIEDKMTTSDGSAQIVPLQFILQNNSLLENGVGPNAKMFSLFMDPKYNSYGLTKYAEFGITNEMIKNTKGGMYDLSKLIEKSYSYGNFARTLVRSEGNAITIPFNILRDFKGNAITIDTVAPGGLFFEKEGEVYQILELTNDIQVINEDLSVTVTKGKYNQFSRKIINLSTKVTTTEPPVDINNLYDLWITLGAENSVTIDPEGKHTVEFNHQDTSFTESDASHHALVEFINRVGYKRSSDQKNNLMAKYGLTDEEFTQVFPEFKVIKSSFQINTQNNTWQPLKNMFIGKFIHTSAQKSGAINVQHIDAVYGKGDVYPVDIPAFSTGVLMDTDHEVEGSMITRMTQIISAIEFMGESHNVSKGVYNAIADVLNIKLKALFDTVVTGNVNKEALYKEVTDNLIKTFNSKDQQSIGKFIGEMVKRENENVQSANARAAAQEQEDKQNREEVSGEVEGASSLPMSIVIAGKRMPFSTYMYSSFVSLMSNFLNKTAIKDKQSGIASPIKPSGSMVQVYDNMKEDISTDEDTGQTYHRYIPSSILSRVNSRLDQAQYVVQQTIAASEISLYDWIKTPDGQEVYLDTPRKLIEAKKLKGNVEKLYGKPRDLRPPTITFNVKGLKEAPMSIYEFPAFSMTYDFKDILDKENPRTAKDSSELVAFLESKGFKKVTDTTIEANSRAINNLLRLNVQSVLNRIDTQKTILFKGKEYPVTNITRTSGEGIGPNIYRTMFGLPKGISVSEVTEEYLFNRIMNKALPATLNDPLCQYYFQNAEGNHVYVYNDVPKNFTEYKQGERIRNVDGKNWVVDDFGDRKFLIGNFQAGYTVVNGKKIEVVIATDDIAKDVLVKQMQETKRIDKNLYVGTMYNTSADNNALLAEESRELATKRFASFRTTLSFVAARIPGQGFQSFTDIDIIDFIHTEGNTVMTNHFTSWLKGEDYDIDKGFWLGLTLKNGTIVGWAKEFDYTTEETLRNSMSLPYPDKRLRTFSEFPEVTLSSEEVDSLFGTGMSRLRSDTLLKLESVNTYSFLGTANQEEVQVKVDEYFMQEIPLGELEDAIKNKMAWGIRDAVTKPSNLTNTETPVSMTDPKDAAAGVSLGNTSGKNPTSKAEFQHANMVGKDVISIAATALKIWSAVSYYGNDMVKGGDLSSILIGKNVKINGKDHYIAAQANLNFKAKAITIITDEFIEDQIDVKRNIEENC